MSSPRSLRELSGTVESRKEPPGAARETWELSGTHPEAAGSCREPPGAAGSCREPGAVMSRQEPPGAVRSRQGDLGAVRSSPSRGREVSGAVRSQTEAATEPLGAAGSCREPPPGAVGMGALKSSTPGGPHDFPDYCKPSLGLGNRARAEILEGDGWEGWGALKIEHYVLHL